MGDVKGPVKREDHGTVGQRGSAEFEFGRQLSVQERERLGTCASTIPVIHERNLR